MNALTASATLTTEIADALCAGEYPVEFESNARALNEPDAPWAASIFERAREQLVAHLASNGPRDKKASPDCCVFAMAKHNYPLTVSMAEAGWEQWQSTIETKTREEAASLGMKFKKFRYAVHFWVSPDHRLALAKVKIEGKFVPGA